MLPGILTIGFYRSGTSWETGLWGQQSISGRNAWRIYGWSYCLGSTVFKTMPEVLGIMPRNL
jgi:hypothetical protein